MDGGGCACPRSFSVPPPMNRIIIIGSSCAGKTTLARKLSAKLNMPHIELDQLFWLPEWKQRPQDEFRSLVSDAIAAERWISCGNFTELREILWNRATHAVWMNYSFPLVFSRAIRRTVRRCFVKEELFSGNYESFRQSFLSRDSILWWVLTTFRRRRRQYRQLFDDNVHPSLKLIELHHPRDAEKLLENLDSG